MKTVFETPDDTEIRVTRVFAAPRERVWQMWTQAEHLVNWWGPEGWTLPVCELDFRVGGEWYYCMQGPDMQSCGITTYEEIVAPERLVHTDAFVDADRKVMDAFPLAHITTIFEEAAGETAVRSSVRYATKQERDTIVEMGMQIGMDQTLDRLDAYLMMPD